MTILPVLSQPDTHHAGARQERALARDPRHMLTPE